MARSLLLSGGSMDSRSNLVAGLGREDESPPHGDDARSKGVHHGIEQAFGREVGDGRGTQVG